MTEDPGTEPVVVHALVINQHSQGITLHGSEEDANAALADYAREWWHQMVGGDLARQEGIPATPDGLGDDEVISYFRQCTDESWEIMQFRLPRALPGGSVILGEALAQELRKQVDGLTGAMRSGEGAGEGARRIAKTLDEVLPPAAGMAGRGTARRNAQAWPAVAGLRTELGTPARETRCRTAGPPPDSGCREPAPPRSSRPRS